MDDQFDKKKEVINSKNEINNYLPQYNKSSQDVNPQNANEIIKIKDEIDNNRFNKISNQADGDQCENNILDFNSLKNMIKKEMPENQQEIDTKKSMNKNIEQYIISKINNAKFDENNYIIFQVFNQNFENIIIKNKQLEGYLIKPVLSSEGKFIYDRKNNILFRDINYKIITKDKLKPIILDDKTILVNEKNLPILGKNNYAYIDEKGEFFVGSVTLEQNQKVTKVKSSNSSR